MAIYLKTAMAKAMAVTAQLLLAGAAQTSAYSS